MTTRRKDAMNRRVRARWPKVLRLEPGDVVLLEVPESATPKQCEAIARRWRDRFPDVPVTVLGGGMRAKVVRAADVSAEAKP
jgi:hypothetical protein